MAQYSIRKHTILGTTEQFFEDFGAASLNAQRISQTIPSGCVSVWDHDPESACYGRMEVWAAGNGIAGTDEELEIRVAESFAAQAGIAEWEAMGGHGVPVRAALQAMRDRFLGGETPRYFGRSVTPSHGDATEWTVCPRCATQIAIDDYQEAAGMCDACIIDTTPEPSDYALYQRMDDGFRKAQYVARAGVLALALGTLSLGNAAAHHQAHPVPIGCAIQAQWEDGSALAVCAGSYLVARDAETQVWRDIPMAVDTIVLTDANGVTHDVALWD